MAQGSKVPSHGRHRILRGFAFAGLVVAVLAALSAITYPLLPTTTNGLYAPYIYGYRLMSEDSLDVFIIGDSSAQCTVAPQVMQSVSGISSYNSSSPLQTAAVSAEVTTEMFSYQNPKVVIYDVNNIFRDTSATTAVETIAQQVVPVLRYHDNWKRILAGTVETGGNALTSDLGFHPKTDVVPYTGGDYMSKTTSGAFLSFWARVYLKWMQRVCAEHGATLILISSPNAKEWNDARHDVIADYAQENGLTYLDFNTAECDAGIDWASDTRDGGEHLNVAGATKVSTWLATWLAQNKGVGTVSAS